jgi:hypothetical protein
MEDDGDFIYGGGIYSGYMDFFGGHAKFEDAKCIFDDELIEEPTAEMDESLISEFIAENSNFMAEHTKTDDGGGEVEEKENAPEEKQIKTKSDYSIL